MGSGSRRRRTAWREQGEGGEFSWQQSRCLEAVAADATVPPLLRTTLSGVLTCPALAASSAPARPASPATPAEQDLDMDARPLRPPDEGERLAVPGELVVAVVPSRGQRSVVAGRPGMRQVHRRVHPLPLRVLAQRQVGLSFQRAPELLVRVGPLIGWGAPPRASLVGHIGTSSTSTPGSCRAVHAR